MFRSFCLFLSFLSLLYGLSFSLFVSKLLTCSLTGEISRNLFSSVSSAFSSLVITLYYSLSLAIYLRYSSTLLFVYISGANSRDFTGLRNSVLPSVTPGLYRFIAFPRLKHQNLHEGYVARLGSYKKRVILMRK